MPNGIAPKAESRKNSPTRLYAGHSQGSAYVVLVTSLVALLLLYWKTVALMVGTWHNSSYAHGFLILPISLYLVWLGRERLIHLVPRPNPLGLLFLAPVCVAWFLGGLAEVVVLQRVALVCMVIGLVWVELGTEFVRALRFPLAFLFFAVPIGDSLIPYLQDFTAWFTVKALDLVGVPVLLEGRILTVGSGAWEVAQACSGVRFLISSLAVGFLYAGVGFRTWKRRILFLILSAMVPILVNGLRVFGIVILGEYRGSAAAAYADHVIYGWFFFSLVTLLLLGIGGSLRERREREAVHAVSFRNSSLSAGNLVSQNQTEREVSSGAIILTALAGLILLALSPFFLGLLNGAAPDHTALPAYSLKVKAPWTIAVRTDSEWVPRFVGTSSELQQVYVSGAHQVVLYLGFYSTRQGTKLASSQNVLYIESHWLRVSEGVSTVAVDGEPSRVHETVIRSARTTWMIWSWYWVNGEFTESGYRAKYLLARSRLFGSKTGSAAIVLATDFTLNPVEAESVLEDFLAHADFFAGSPYQPH